MALPPMLVPSVSLTTEDTDVFTFSTARVGQSAGKNANTASTADKGKSGGAGIAAGVKLDTSSNTLNLRFIGNADVTGSAGEKGKSEKVGGDGGDALNASNVESLNIAVIGTKKAGVTADVVKFTAGAAGAATVANNAGSAGSVGQTVVVGTNATITLTSELDGVDGAVHNGIDLGTVKGTNVTVDGSIPWCYHRYHS